MLIFTEKTSQSLKLEFSCPLCSASLFFKVLKWPKIAFPSCVVTNWGSCFWSVQATVFPFFIFTTHVPSSASEIRSSAQHSFLTGPQHPDLWCCWRSPALAGMICLDECLGSMETGAWLEYRGKMMLQRALQVCLFPFQTELIITAPGAIAHHSF